MHGKLNLVVYCLLLSCFLGCSSKADLDLLSNDYRIAQAQIEKLHLRIQDLEEENVQCQKANAKMEKLRLGIQELEEENVQCQKANAKNEIIVSVLSDVIKLLDDPKQTIQKSIQERLMEQNIEVDVPITNH